MPAKPRPYVRAALCCALFFVADLAAAATLPPGFSESQVAGGLTRPTAMAFAPDGRLFICEQDGTLRIVKDGVLLAAPFVSLTVNSAGERGLLGVTFDPDFANNGFVYVYYTATTPTVHNRISRLVDAGDVAAPGFEERVLDLEPLGATNHNGGAIHFGPDGKLYVAVGDNAVRANAQTLENRLGKILRLNADGSIPSDNPYFLAASGANRAIWALGLRNPFTFGFQAYTGTMFLNDVGENTWEEINLGVPGSNYGWPNAEGPDGSAAFRRPVYAYDHNQGCAISGGAFHSLLQPQFPYKYWGAYFFADFCGGWIRARLSTGTVVAFASGMSQPVDLQSAADGSLYYLARGTGSVWRISHSSPPAPGVDVSANGTDGPLTLSAGMSLQIDLALETGTPGGFPAAELYIGVLAPGGVVYHLSQSGTFVREPVRYYAGRLPSFPSATLVRLNDVAGLQRGNYVWWMLVDQQIDGINSGELADFAFTRIE